DAVRGRAAHLDAHTDEIPLFTMGAFTVTFHAGGTIDVGKPTTTMPPDDRALQGVPSWWPLVSRSGDLTPSPWPGYLYDGEPWVAPSTIDSALASLTAFGLPGASTSAQFTAGDPLLMRALEDDDHHLQTATSVGLTGAVSGSFGFDLGIAHFQLTGTGTLGVSGAVQMDVRDGEMALPTVPAARTVGSPAAIPLTAVTATPSTSATASIGFTVGLHIHIPLIFDDIDEDIGIINASAEHTWGGTPWAQQNRALLATGSSYGDPRIQPWAVSHLPFTGTPSASYPTYPVFNSFDQSVDACLADPATPPPPPPPCQAPPPTAPPHGNVCVFSGSMQQGYGTPASWVGVCSSIPSHVDSILGAAAPAAQKKCYVDTLNAICKATSKEQDWRGQHGVAHIINTLVPTDIDIGALASECTTAFEPQNHTATFNRIFEFGPCDDSATMLDPKTVVVPKSPGDGTPSPVTAGTCN
ncbi:MAG: hypothetical protein JO257_11960, partial [Deltaproteobacteria bacterium]|nr:hypothetical protein [Deltaproteobacteria bacterium]